MNETVLEHASTPLSRLVLMTAADLLFDPNTPEDEGYTCGVVAMVCEFLGIDHENFDDVLELISYMQRDENGEREPAAILTLVPRG